MIYMPKSVNDILPLSIFAFTLFIALLSCESGPEAPLELPISFENPATGNSAMSRLFRTDQALYMSWVEQRDSLAILKFAQYKSDAWSAPLTIAEGTDWFVNWADFPAIAVNDGNIFAHYLKKSAPDTYAYDVQYTVFNKDLGQWSTPQKLHTDTTQSEHGFVSVIPYKEGFMATWLDGRTTVNRPDSLKQMTLRAGFVNADGSLGKQWELDQRVCDCCSTSISNSPEGPIVVYRDRSDREIRDIYFTKFEAGNWSESKPVYIDNWEINGCPVNGPAIAANANTTSAVWFTAANDRPMVNLVMSKDINQGFGDPIRLDIRPAIGRVAVQIDQQGNTYALFMSESTPDAVLSLAVFNPKGQQLRFMDLFRMNGERSSGFPQLAFFKEQLIISYSNVGEDPGIKTLKIPIIDLLKQ